MAWFKIDDRLWGHPKWLATPPRARGLWASAGSWCASNETDGAVPSHVLPVLSGTRADANALVKAGLWDETEDGFSFHGWAEFQPTRAELDERREQDRQRKAEWRAQKASKRGGVTEMSQRDTPGTDAGTGASVRQESALTRPDPTRPDPTHNEHHSSEIADATPRPDERPEIEEILDHLEAAIRANDAKVPTRGKTARTAVRLMIDRDGRNVDSIKAAIDFATGDEFWRGNILSAPKLREKFDQLRFAAQRGGWKPKDRHQRNADFWETEMAQAHAIAETTNNSQREIEAS